jgi:hypothetical protein
MMKSLWDFLTVMDKMDTVDNVDGMDGVDWPFLDSSFFVDTLSNHALQMKNQARAEIRSNTFETVSADAPLCECMWNLDAQSRIFPGTMPSKEEFCLTPAGGGCILTLFLVLDVEVAEKSEKRSTSPRPSPPRLSITHKYFVLYVVNFRSF